MLFCEKYHNINERFGLSKTETMNLLNKFDDILVEELYGLDINFKIDKYFIDNRSVDKYIYDLIDGQLMEELICMWFRKNGHKAKRTGCDSVENVHIDSNKISTYPDILVDGTLLEIQTSRKGRLPFYNIKKSKGDRVLRGLNNIMMIVGDEYFIIDKYMLSKAEKVNFALWGNKVCYKIIDNDIRYLKF